MNQTKDKKQFRLPANLVRYVGLFCVILLTMAAFQAASGGSFLKPGNLMNAVKQSAVLAILSIGMTCVILTGNIDLSVGAGLAAASCTLGKVIEVTGNPFLGLLSAVVISMAFGMVSGVLVGKLRLNAFIVTLAMQYVCRGEALFISGAKSTKINDPVIMFLGKQTVGILPISIFIVVLLFAAVIFNNSKMKFGREIYAVGGSKEAARACGINTDRTIIKAYLLCGLCVGIAGIINTGRLGSAQQYAGQNMEFDVITAVVLGGTSLSGGIGTLGGTALGVILMGVITNGLGIIDINAFFDYFLQGAMLLTAFMIDNYSTKRMQKAATPVIAPEKPWAENKALVDKVKAAQNRVVSMKHIHKAYPGVMALDDVSVEFRPGEIHAIAGENGAGKSTLMNVLSGTTTPSSGEIFIDDCYVNIDSPLKAKDLNIAIIHQENSLFRNLTVAQNIFFGKEPKTPLGLIDRRKMNAQAKKLLKEIGIELDVSKKIQDMSVSQQQMAEIAKALCAKARLLIMDEPTAALTENEKEYLFGFIRELRAQGVSIVYISHRMQEILDFCDRVTILRDGKMVGSYNISEITEEEIVRKMVGHSLSNIFDREKTALGDVVLEVRNLSKQGVFEDVSFQIKAGEVLAFNGLIGAGRTEIAKCICGLDIPDSGTVLMDGKPVCIVKPSDALEQGIAYVTEDRKLEGFVPYMSIRENLAMPSYGNISRLGYIFPEQEKRISDQYFTSLKIKAPSDDKNVVELSGGNQQKVSLGKWLARSPRVLILDEPTRGIDVGAKSEIHAIIGSLTKQGIAVILISSEMPEVLGCADNIIILRKGQVRARLNAADTSQEEMLKYAIL